MNQELLQSALDGLNLLDTYEEVGDETCAYFFANEDHQRGGPSAATVTLRISGDVVKVDQSRTLPTRGWCEHARAINRAEEFCYLIGGSD